MNIHIIFRHLICLKTWLKMALLFLALVFPQDLRWKDYMTIFISFSTCNLYDRRWIPKIQLHYTLYSKATKKSCVIYCKKSVPDSTVCTPFGLIVFIKSFWVLKHLMSLLIFVCLMLFSNCLNSNHLWSYPVVMPFTHSLSIIEFPTCSHYPNLTPQAASTMLTNSLFQASKQSAPSCSPLLLCLLLILGAGKPVLWWSLHIQP